MQELSILTTETDLTTHDISKMGDYFSNYVSGLKKQLESQANLERVDFSPATIEIIAEVIDYGVKTFKNVQYIADFGALPLDIQKKYKAGKLVLQHSNKVPGNSVQFLVDKNEPGKIVANLTLKKVRFNPNNMDLTRNMTTQIQLKQISEKLDCIDEKINYQIQRDRDEALMVPFFTARDYIRDAQVTKDEDEREEYLDQAMDYLKKVYNSAYLDLVTSSKWMAEHTKSSLFMKHKDLTKYMIYMCEDVYMMNKSVGLQLQIYDYQDKKEEASVTFRAYADGLVELSEKKVGINGETALGLLQDYYPYNRENLNMWINFMNAVKELSANISGIDMRQNVYLLCAEA